MYGFAKPDRYIPLEGIMQRVTQEQIFKIVFGYEPEENVYVTSPFREDEDPGCWFEYYKGKLFFVDFGDAKKHRTCIESIMEYYGISFKETLHLIDDYYSIGYSDDSIELKKPLKVYERRKVKDEDLEKTKIIFRAKPFTQVDFNYWFQYGITLNQLIEDSVFAVRWFKVYSKKKKQWSVIRPDTITYCYSEFKNRVKIYSPFGDKKYKWLSNLTQDDLGNINNLPLNGEELIISKSYKDCRLLRNYGNHCIWSQGEGMIPSSDIIVNLSKRFNRIKVFYDNDDAGKKGAINLSDTINSHFPGKSSVLYLPTIEKDPSDLFKNDKNQLENILKQWKLYHK